MTWSERHDLLSLLVRPRPVAGEAAMGYMSRVADANGYSTLGTFRAALVSAGDPEPFERACRLLGLTEAEAALLRGPMSNAWNAIPAPYGLDVSHFNHRWIRWCPQCVALQALIRWEWTLRLMLAGAPMAHARSTAKQTKAQKDAQKQWKKYSKQYNKQQKKQLKAQQKQMKQQNKNRTVITVT